MSNYDILKALEYEIKLDRLSKESKPAFLNKIKPLTKLDQSLIDQYDAQQEEMKTNGLLRVKDLPEPIFDKFTPTPIVDISLYNNRHQQESILHKNIKAEEENIQKLQKYIMVIERNIAHLSGKPGDVLTPETINKIATHEDQKRLGEQYLNQFSIKLNNAQDQLRNFHERINVVEATQQDNHQKSSKTKYENQLKLKDWENTINSMQTGYNKVEQGDDETEDAYLQRLKQTATVGVQYKIDQEIRRVTQKFKDNLKLLGLPEMFVESLNSWINSNPTEIDDDNLGNIRDLEEEPIRNKSKINNSFGKFKAEFDKIYAGVSFRYGFDIGEIKEFIAEYLNGGINRPFTEHAKRNVSREFRDRYEDFHRGPNDDDDDEHTHPSDLNSKDAKMYEDIFENDSPAHIQHLKNLYHHEKNRTSTSSESFKGTRSEASALNRSLKDLYEPSEHSHREPSIHSHKSSENRPFQVKNGELIINGEPIIKPFSPVDRALEEMALNKALEKFENPKLPSLLAEITKEKNGLKKAPVTEKPELPSLLALITKEKNSLKKTPVTEKPELPSLLALITKEKKGLKKAPVIEKLPPKQNPMLESLLESKTFQKIINKAPSIAGSKTGKAPSIAGSKTGDWDVPVAKITRKAPSLVISEKIEKPKYVRNFKDVSEVPNLPSYTSMPLTHLFEGVKNRRAMISDAISKSGSEFSDFEYIPKTNYKVNIAKLEQGTLVLKTKSGQNVQAIPNQNVSTDFLKIMNSVLNGNVISKPRIEKLSNKEQTLLGLVKNITGTGLIDKDHIKNGLQHLKDRLDLIIGEVDAGNTNESLKKEAKKILTQLLKIKAITKKDHDRFLYELLNN